MNIDTTSKIYYDFEALLTKYSKDNRGNSVVGMINGTFDLMHPGHYYLFESASKMCDHLLIFTNTDESIRELKGYGRPLIPLKHRLKVLSSIIYIDAIYPFNSLRVTDCISKLNPDIWVKASDYNLENIDADELRVAKELGVEIRIVDTLGMYSSTGLINKIMKSKLEKKL